MFYSQEILQKRGGRFGIIWIAATRVKSLTRREFCSVNLNKTCDDILDIIYLRASARQHGAARPRLSLYLSAQLMYGLIKVYSKQRDYLLSDVSAMSTKFKLATAVTNDIDLRGYQRSDAVTNPDFVALSSREGPGFDPTFGRFIFEEDIHFDIIPEMEMWKIQPSPEVLLSPLGSPVRRELLPGVVYQPVGGSPHTVSSSEITMVEEIDQPIIDKQPVHVEDDLPPLDDLGLQMLAHGVGLESYSLDVILSPTHAVSTPMQQPLGSHFLNREVLPQLEETPIVDSGIPNIVDMPARVRRGHQPSPGVTPQVIEKQKTPKRKRESLAMELSTDVTPSPPTRRRKRRLLFTDKETQIRKEVQRENMRTGKNTCRQFELPSVGFQSVRQMFTRPGRKDWTHPLLLRLFERNTVSQPYPESDDSRHPIWTLPDMSVSSGRSPPVEEQEEQRAEATQDMTAMSTEMPRDLSLTMERSRRLDNTPLAISLERDLQASTSMERTHISPPPKRPKVSVGTSSEDEVSDFQMIEQQDVELREVSSRQQLFPVPELNEDVALPQLDVLAERISDTEEQLISSVSSQTSVEKWTTFKRICPPNSNTRSAAARMFTKLLECSAASKLRCRQKQPYGNIYIARGPHW